MQGILTLIKFRVDSPTFWKVKAYEVNKKKHENRQTDNQTNCFYILRILKWDHCKKRVFQKSLKIEQYIHKLCVDIRRKKHANELYNFLRSKSINNLF